MKKIKYIALFILIILLITGCTTHEIDEDDPMKTYRDIYDGKAKEKYENIEGEARYLASHGYIQNEKQGHNHWYYYAIAEEEKIPMTYENSAFRYLDTYMNEGVIKLSTDIGAVRKFIAPISKDNVLIHGTVKIDEAIDNSEQVKLRILINNELAYPEIDLTRLDTIGKYFSFNKDLKVGDHIDFELTGSNKVFFNPIVDFTNQSIETLYQVPEWGYFGDVHQYYYNDVVNLFHLRDLPGGHWEWYLWQTHDMFRYKEALVYDTTFVKNHYMAYAHIGDLNDYEQYPKGARDATMFFDEEIQRYRYIALSYKENDAANVSTDLSMRVSDDEHGLIWSTPATALRSFPTKSDGEPEVAAFRKIGNRWYLYASISGQSKHGVGKTSYWIGDENKGIDEVEWSSKQTYSLDGEDLAAAQIEWVKDKLYFYGWMPRVWDAGYWGGIMNLPREVIVRENGILGTRLDPMATSLLNKGVIDSFNQNNATVRVGNASIQDQTILMDGKHNRVMIPGTFNATFITYQVKMNEATEASFIMKQAGKEYHVQLKKEGKAWYLKILSPQESSHNLNSYVIYENNNDDIFEVKIIVHGGVIEFFVNDHIALSGRTNMQMDYQAEIYANGNAEFKDVYIHRLAQYYDIYE
ncbi:glycoside hydrolase family protein [Acholeplasma laidlawii]|uniref:hypothetical protein n=1 Tax=Acholeplasma laidlawii TaxID=2148 RepID=UPI0021F703F1|nr:hypothetical protein [Acholeplasma laidlawii]